MSYLNVTPSIETQVYNYFQRAALGNTLFFWWGEDGARWVEDGRGDGTNVS